MIIRQQQIVVLLLATLLICNAAAFCNNVRTVVHTIVTFDTLRTACHSTVHTLGMQDCKVYMQLVACLLDALG